MNRKSNQSIQNSPAKSVSELQSRLEHIVLKCRNHPAQSMPDLQNRLEYIVMQFPVEARKGIVIHPNSTKMTGENRNDGYLYSNCGGSSSADGNEECKCKCARCRQNDDNSNFITNYRESNATGSTGRMDARFVTKAKSGAATVLVISAIFVLGVLLVSGGEKVRNY